MSASPPESHVGSPETSTFESVIMKMQALLKSGELELELDGVTPALLAELRAHMIDEWEGLRVDFCPDKLIVRFAEFGHGIMFDLLRLMNKPDTGYPEYYGNSSIMAGGSANIHYCGGGYKSPDFSLYEFKDSKGTSSDCDSASPTIAFEVGYTQPSRSLTTEAARHICLTLGEVLLVVAIDITHEPNSHPRKLQTVTWSHWEEDIRAFRMVPKHDGEELNEVRAERNNGEDDVPQALPQATAFSALMSIGDEQRCHIRATETAKWELFPDPKISQINILHRHLYRYPNDTDMDTPVICLSVSDIMAAIFKREAVQQLFDKRPEFSRRAKGRAGQT